MAQRVDNQVAVAARRRRPRGFWGDALSRLLRNRLSMVGLGVISLLAVATIFAPFLAPKGFADVDLQNAHAAPGREYLLGADFLGRDLLSRLIYGARVSLTVGVLGAAMALIIGTVYGSVSGWFGGWVDGLMMRFVDIMYALPSLLFVIILMVFFRAAITTGEDLNPVLTWIRTVDRSMGGMLVIFIGIGVTTWMTLARMVRGSILSLRETEFILAARALGATDQRIIVRHLVPNFLGPVIVYETLRIPEYILLEATLSFIGLGVSAPTPSWGLMINEGAQAMRSYPHLVLFPAITLSLTLMAFNLVGDGLRDALDPRMR